MVNCKSSSAGDASNAPSSVASGATADRLRTATANDVPLLPSLPRLASQELLIRPDESLELQSVAGSIYMRICNKLFFLIFHEKTRL